MSKFNENWDTWSVAYSRAIYWMLTKCGKFPLHFTSAVDTQFSSHWTASEERESRSHFSFVYRHELMIWIMVCCWQHWQRLHVARQGKCSNIVDTDTCWDTLTRMTLTFDHGPGFTEVTEFVPNLVTLCLVYEVIIIRIYWLACLSLQWPMYAADEGNPKNLLQRLTALLW